MSWSLTCPASFAAILKPAGRHIRSRWKRMCSIPTRCDRSRVGTRAVKPLPRQKRLLLHSRKQMPREAQMADLVTLNVAKLYLRVDGDDEDETHAALITAASGAVVVVATDWVWEGGVQDVERIGGGKSSD